MDSIKLKNIYLVTDNLSIVDFFRKAIGVSAKIYAVSEFPDSVFYDSFVVLDASMLEVSSLHLFEQLGSISYPIICLVSPSLSTEIRQYVEKHFLFVIPFPFQKEFVASYLNRFAQYIRSMNIFSSSVFNNKNVSNTYRTRSVNNKDFSSFSGYEDDSLFGCLMGNSNLMKSIRKKVEKAATTDSPVLLLGETGSGKTTGAKIIHKLSKRGGKKMVSLNVATVSESIACSTFFGTVNGAYTDAENKNGFFKLADKSTLFLDEIGIAPTYVQSTLLTVIETGCFRKVGSDVYEKTDVRLIFATNSDLELMIHEGTFRQDFLNRICANVIIFPPLRDRTEDIPNIAKSYLKKRRFFISDDGINKLMGHKWLGNIRELNQCLDRAIINASSNIIDADDIDFGLFRS